MVLALVAHAQVQDWDGCLIEGVPTINCLETVFSNLLFLSSAIVLLILFIMFVVGSLRYLTSGGDAEKLKSSRAVVTYALIGFAIFLCSYLILNIVDVLFLGGSGKIFEFAIPPLR